MKEQKKQTHQFGRLVSVHQQIMTEMSYGLVFLLLASLIIKVFIYDSQLMSYVTELVCLGFVILYSIFRHIRMGVDLSLELTGGWKVALFSSFLMTTVFGIFHFQANAKQYIHFADRSFLMVLGVFFLAVFMTQFLVLLIIGYRQKKKKVAIEAQFKTPENSVAEVGEE